MKSKTIILSELNSHNPRAGRGILTLTSDNNTLTLKLRLYNIDALNFNSKLGIYYRNQVYSANLSKKSGYYEGKIQQNFDMNEDFYCAVIDKEKNNEVVIAGGTYAGYYFDDSSVFSENNSFSEQNLYESNGSLDEENSIDLNNENNKNYSNLNTNSIETSKINCGEDSDCEKCTHCIYKETFYSKPDENDFNLKETNEKNQKNYVETNRNSETFVQNENNSPVLKSDNEENIKIDNKSIINSIIPQFEYIFENYPPDDELNKLIENSKFVKVDDNSQSYSIGAIYENDKMKYICYAVKANYNSPAPEELGKFHQWLPIDLDDPLSEGYHIVYQDANDLKIIEV